MKKLLLLSLLCACATAPRAPPPTLNYPPAVRPPPYTPPGTGAPPIGQPGQVGRPTGPRLPRSPNRRTLPATPEQQGRLGIWASDQPKPGALAVITTTRPPGVSEEAWTDCEQRVSEVTFDQGTVGWEQRELFAGLTAKDAACLWERLMRQCVADRGTASSVEEFEAAMGSRINTACQGTNNHRNAPISVLFRGVRNAGQTHQWTSVTRRNRDAGLRTEPIPLPPVRRVPVSEQTINIPTPRPPPPPLPTASEAPETLRAIIHQRPTSTPASTTREAWAKCWQDVVDMLLAEPDVLRLSAADLRCLRSRMVSVCGTMMLDAARDHRHADTGADFLDRYFPARQWDFEGWVSHRERVDEKWCGPYTQVPPHLRYLERRLTDRAEAGWKL